ncbi:MAG: hypothetical protein KF758_16540 [Anaerolineales bacterium]|nr:hypothetical protein [Anaerolineales bacterium]
MHKQLILIIYIIILSACTSQDISTSAPMIDTVPLVLSPTATSVFPIQQICSNQSVLGDLPVSGKLIYSDYLSLFSIEFPDIQGPSSLNLNFLDFPTSPNNHYFLILNDDDSLGVVDFNNDVLYTTLWQKDWESLMGWRNDKEVLIRTIKPNEIVIYKFASDIFYKQVFNFPDEPNPRILITDPNFRVVVYIYSSFIENTGIFQYDRLRVWDEKEQKEILMLDDEFSSFASSLALSPSGIQIAITTVTPNEDENHSEIIVVNTSDGTWKQVSNFRSYFNEFLITDVQWSPDDETIFFWGVKDSTSTDGILKLFSLNINSKQISEYCFHGIAGKNNSLIWVSNSTDLFFVSDKISDDIQNILLVNLIEDKVYQVAENVNMIGWLAK